MSPGEQNHVWLTPTGVMNAKVMGSGMYKNCCSTSEGRVKWYLGGMIPKGMRFYVGLEEK